MVKNENYWNVDSLAGPDTLQFTLMEDDAAQLTAFQSGELDFIEDEFFAFHEVDDASGRADDDVDSLIQFFELNADELSSVEGGDAEIGVPLQGIEFFRDLNGEFPGRGENEGFGVSVAAADCVDDRNAECRCFACSGLSLPDDVSFSFEEEWDR